MSYDKNIEGAEVYEFDGEKTFYKVDPNTGKPIFAKDQSGNYYYGFKFVDGKQVEYLPVDMVNGETIKIIDSLANDTFIYPCNLQTGDPIYENNKYWTSKVLGEYYGTNYYHRNDQTYARDSNLRDILAKNEDGEEYYAKNLTTEEEHYPIDYANEKEFYKKIDGVEYPTNLNEYAKNRINGEEIYPKISIKNFF